LMVITVTSPGCDGDVICDMMLSNMTFLMIFAVFDQSPLTLWINCSISVNICCFIVKIVYCVIA